VFVAVLQQHRARGVDQQNEYDVEAGHPEIVTYILVICVVPCRPNDRICRDARGHAKMSASVPAKGQPDSIVVRGKLGDTSAVSGCLASRLRA